MELSISATTVAVVAAYATIKTSPTCIGFVSGSWNWSSTNATTANPAINALRFEMLFSCSLFSSTSRRFFSAYLSQIHRAFSSTRCSTS